MSLSCTVSDI